MCDLQLKIFYVKPNNTSSSTRSSNKNSKKNVKKSKQLSILVDLKRPQALAFDKVVEYLQLEEINLECDPFN